MRAPAKTFVRARRLRRAMSKPEVLLWNALRALDTQVPRFRRQHPIGPYVLDFYAPEARLAVEVDGAAHDIPSQAIIDATRDAWLAARQIRVLRLNAADILDARRHDNVLQTIIAGVTKSCRPSASRRRRARSLAPPSPPCYSTRSSRFRLPSMRRPAFIS